MTGDFGSLIGSSAEPRLKAAAECYAYWWDNEFSLEHDPSKIHGESNHFRYHARPWHLIRFQTVEDANQLEDAALIALACKTVGTPLLISVTEATETIQRFAKSTVAKLKVESDEELVARLKTMKGGTLRIFGAYDAFEYSPAEIGNLPIVAPAALANGRIELLNYLKEQATLRNLHSMICQILMVRLTFQAMSRSIN